MSVPLRVGRGPHRLLLTLIAFLVALAVLAAACTSDNGEGAATPTEGPEGTTTPTPTGAASPTETPIFRDEARVLDVAISEPSTLDPMRIQDPGAVLVARQLFEGLLAWDPVAEQVEPGVAEDWRMTDGGRTFTFQLAAGTTYHDGTPVTADHFVFAFNRIARRGSGSELAYTLERVQGFEDVNGRGTSRSLAGLRAPDERTLVIRLSEPYTDFPVVLTHPGLVPLEPTAARDIDAFLRQPVGNGPFEMAQPWTPGEPVILKRFDGYIETPFLEGIRFQPFPDAAASWLNFVDGDFHVAEVPAGQTDAAAQEYGDRGFQPFMAGYYFGVNLRSDPLQSLRLRKAVSRAIDRGAIATRIYQGVLRPARGIVPHGMPGFQENVCIPLCEYDEDAAKRMVRGIPKRQRVVRIDYTSGPPHRQVVNAVRRNLRDVGLRVQIRSFPLGDYLRRLRRGQQGVYRLGWIAEYPAPDVFLGDLFASDAPDNHSGFSSRRVDRLLARADRERDDGARTQIYLQAERAILEELPVIPIGSFVTHWVAQENVQDIRFDAAGGFDALDITLTEDEPESNDDNG